jgi:hypothetical protein
MKKIYNTLFVVITGILLLSSCTTNDIDEIYSQKKAEKDSANFSNYTKAYISDTATFITLTDANYAKSSVSGIKSNKNLSDAYPAKTYLPEILNNAYITKEGHQLTVYYNYYNPLNLKDSLVYSVQDGEYNNGDHNDYNTVSQVYSFLTNKYPEATRGTIVFLTYKWYSSGVTTVTNTFVCLGTEWIQITPFVLANYQAMGQKYANFTSVDDARYNIPIFLKSTYLPFAKAGDMVLVQYATYIDKATAQNVLLLSFNGAEWKIIDAVVKASSVFGYNGHIWNFVPPLDFILVTETATRAYTLTNADYYNVGNGKYNDFDRRPGQSEGDDAVFLAKIGKILKLRFTDIAANQVYAVTYKDFDGTITEKTVNVKAIPSEE